MMLYGCLHYSCISYYSYIKPQLYCHSLLQLSVVYRTIPTSNHNLNAEEKKNLALYIVLFLHQTTTVVRVCWRLFGLYIVLFLHQTTTMLALSFFRFRCISYYSYIKPQLRKSTVIFIAVVYRTIPTSNHNFDR